MRIPGPVLLLPVFLAGCALPPAVTVASLVADGVSLVATGKSTTDHAISAFVQEDCALLRAVEGKEICDPDGEVLIALDGADGSHDDWYFDHETSVSDTDWVASHDLQATAPATQAAVQESGRPAGVRETDRPTGAEATGSADTPAGASGEKSLSALARSVAITTKPAPLGAFRNARPAPKPVVLPATDVIDADGGPHAARDADVSTFAVIASFRNAQNAQRMVASQGDGAFVQAIVVGGATTYRVLVDRPIEAARAIGFADAWPVQLCAQARVAPPCGQIVVNGGGLYTQVASR